MGGTTFEQYQSGADVAQAFRDASDQAAYEHGHGGYTGTLAEKPGYTIITHDPLPEAEAYALVNKLYEASDPRIDDKWGDAGAIPVLKVDDAKKRQVTLTFDVAPNLGYDVKAKTIDTEARRLAQPKLKANERIISVRIREDKQGRARVTAVAPKDKAETRYIVRQSRKHQTWANGLPTQAAARQHATDLANTESAGFNHHDDVAVFEVEAVTRRCTGDPLVTVTRAVSKHTVTVEVDILAQTQSLKTTPDGWLFFGWASC